MDARYIMTQEGFDKLKEEFESRCKSTRREIADELETARAQGDLSENAAYHAAIKMKEFNEARISELDDLIKKADIRAGNSRNQKIDIGEEFILKDLDLGTHKKYKLVGASEADTQKGLISPDSPIGKVVFGKQFGDKVKLTLPSGERNFKIENA